MALTKKIAEEEMLKILLCHFFPYCKESFATNEDLIEHLAKHSMSETNSSFSFFDGTPLQTPRNSGHHSPSWPRNSTLMTEREKTRFSDFNGAQKFPLNEITNTELRNDIKEMDRGRNSSVLSGFGYDCSSSLGILNLDNVSNFSFDEPVKLPKESNHNIIKKRNSTSTVQGKTFNASLKSAVPKGYATNSKQNITKSNSDKEHFGTDRLTHVVNKNALTEVFPTRDSNSNMKTPNMFQTKMQPSSHLYSGQDTPVPFNKWFQNVVSSTFQESSTPSKLNPFHDVSSFQVDDIYKSLYATRKDSELPERPFAALESSKISFCIDQISGRSSSLGSADIEKLEKSKATQGSPKSFANFGMCDFNLEKNALEDFDLDSDVFTDNSGFKKDLDEREKELESGKIGNSNLKLSEMSVQFDDQYVKRPSWWNDPSGNDDSYISASRFIAAKTEPINAFGISEEYKEQPTFRQDRNSHQNATEYYGDSKQEKPTKKITGKHLKLASSNAEQEKKTSAKSNIDHRDISKLISELSLSTDFSIIANRLLPQSTEQNAEISQTAKQNSIVCKSNSGQNSEFPENSKDGNMNTCPVLPFHPNKGASDRVAPPCNVVVQTTTRVSAISSSDTFQNNISPTNNPQCGMTRSHSGSKVAVNLDATNCTKISSVSSQESSCSNCSQTQTCFSHASGSCHSACSNMQKSCMLNAKTLPEHYFNMLLQNQNFQSIAATNSMASRTLPSYALPFALNAGATMNSVIIIGPTEINLPVMCVGDNQKKSIELKNITNVPLHYHLSLTSATLNDEPFAVKSTGVTVPRTISVAATGVADVPVEFLARIVGKFKLTLRVIPSFSQSEENPMGLPLTITISFETVEPRISLLYEGKDEINIDSILEKSIISRTLTLANYCKASLPLRLNIYSKQQNHHSLDFDVGKIKSKEESAIEWTHILPHMLLCRLQGTTSSEPKVVKIPVTFHSGKCMTENENVFFAMVTADLESPIPKETFMVREMLKVTATIGSVNISIVHPTKLIVLKAENNSKSSCLLRVVNTGTVSVFADLAVHCESEENMEEFSILPPTVELQPKKEVMINVSYKPVLFQNVKGVIQAAVQCDGEVFDLIEVEGVILNKNCTKRRLSSYQRTSAAKKLPALTPNKKFMAWGGVVPGKCSYNNLVVRNRSPNVLLNGYVYLKEHGGAFEIIGDDGERLEKMHLELEPNSGKNVKVSFLPTDVKAYQGELILKSKNPDINVPLSGYGGISNIEFHGVSEKNDQPFVQLSFQGDKGVFATLKLSNNGLRAAYVAVAGELNIPAEEAKFTIEPAKFVILPNQAEIVSVRLLHLNSEACIFQAGHRCGSIEFFYGDEILRQKVRRSQHDYNKNSKYKTMDTKNIKFKSCFKNEDSVPIDEAFTDSQDNVQLFHSCMKSFKCDVNFGAATELFDRTCDFDSTLLQETF